MSKPPRKIIGDLSHEILKLLKEKPELITRQIAKALSIENVDKVSKELYTLRTEKLITSHDSHGGSKHRITELGLRVLETAVIKPILEEVIVGQKQEEIQLQKVEVTPSEAVVYAMGVLQEAINAMQEHVESVKPVVITNKPEKLKTLDHFIAFCKPMNNDFAVALEGIKADIDGLAGA